MTLYRTRDYALRRVVRNVSERLDGYLETEDEIEQLISNLTNVWAMDNRKMPDGAVFEFRKEIGNRVEMLVMDRLTSEKKYDVFRNYEQDASHRLDFLEMTPDGVINMCDVKSTMGNYSESVYVFEIKKSTIEKYKRIAISYNREFYLYVFLIRKNAIYKLNIRDMVLIGDWYMYNFSGDVPMFTLDIVEYYEFLKWYGDFAYKMVDLIEMTYGDYTGYEYSMSEHL